MLPNKAPKRDAAKTRRPLALRWVAMKQTLLLAVFCVMSGPVFADDDYSHIVYTATAFKYWCTYSKVPNNIEDFAKVTNVNHNDPRITLGVNDWFKSVQFEIQGSNVKITRRTEEIKNGRVQTAHVSTATSDCGSFKPPLKQPNKPFEGTR